MLSDPDKRKKYDKHGEDGLKDQITHSDPFDMFESFFGGGGGRSSQQRNKGPDLHVKIRVTLEDIYNGKEIPVIVPNLECLDLPDEASDLPELQGKWRGRPR